ncbi:MAG: hypothetical protein ABFD89_03735 [Bryobacteraceae bacterium]
MTTKQQLEKDVAFLRRLNTDPGFHFEEEEKRTIAAIADRLEKSLEANIWWDDDDPDQSIESLNEFFCDAEYDVVYEFQAARMLPTEYYVKVSVSDKLDWDIVRATPEEIEFHKAEQKRRYEESRAKSAKMAEDRQKARAYPENPAINAAAEKRQDMERRGVRP